MLGIKFNFPPTYEIESTKLSDNIIKIKTITVTVITIKYELN